jgi:hypothetical protein
LTPDPISTPAAPACLVGGGGAGAPHGLVEQSWKWGLLALVAVVRRLAMLVEMTWTLSSWAIIPGAAVCIARKG